MFSRRFRRVLPAVCLALFAGPAVPPLLAQARGAVVPPPAAPDTIARDDNGQATIRAVRIERAIQLDGRLDEEIYQHDPADRRLHPAGAERGRASHREDRGVGVLRRPQRLRQRARCWDSHPEREVDHRAAPRQQQHHAERELHLRLRHVPRSAQRATSSRPTPLGALRDQAIVDDVLNSNWNTVWDVRTGRFEGGWTRNSSIPFKSLRYRGAGTAGLGRQLPAGREVEERVSRTSRRCRRRYGTDGDQPHGSGRRRWSASRRRAVEEHRAEAIRRGVDGHRRTARPRRRPTTSDGNAGFDFKYGLTREPHRRRDRAHRFRAGRRGPAAGEPDALQPVLPGEARLLPRGAGDLRVRRRRFGQRRHARATCR